MRKTFQFLLYNSKVTVRITDSLQTLQCWWMKECKQAAYGWRSCSASCEVDVATDLLLCQGHHLHNSYTPWYFGKHALRSPKIWGWNQLAISLVQSDSLGFLLKTVKRQAMFGPFPDYWWICLRSMLFFCQRYSKYIVLQVLLFILKNSGHKPTHQLEVLDEF